MAWWRWMRNVTVASTRAMLSWPPVSAAPTPLTKYSRPVTSSEDPVAEDQPQREQRLRRDAVVVVALAACR